jgi:pilus assembly protein CpaC
MLRSSIFHKNWAVALAVFLLLVIIPMGTRAADSLVQETMTAKKLNLISGKSVILKSTLPIKRVSIANPEIADFLLLSPHDIYLTGKTAGTTNLTLWQNNKVTEIYDLEVAYDLSRLKQQVHEVLPAEKDLQIISTNDSITLAGRMINTANLSKVTALARSYAPKGKINNLVQVGGVHQVMLEVRIAEISRSTTKELGINFNYINNGDFGVSLLGGLSQLAENATDSNILTSGAPFALKVSPAVNALFRFSNGNSTWTGLIDALQEDGLVKVLAEPTLIALSGQTANFLAGGEFPIPVPQGLGTVAIDYKKFGVGLNFTPTVLSEGVISINVSPEVSELDFSTAVQFSGFVVPGITTRRASTTIELADGQSFAIAGLLRDSIKSQVSKFPLLGDIPILGALFRSQSFLKNKTELIIIVTPHLVKPLNMAKQTLPTDYYIEPNDAEFYLEGRMEGRGNGQPGVSGKLDGTFGHSMPEDK